MASSDALAWVEERIDLLEKHTAVCPACASLTTVDNDPLVDDAVEMRLVWAVIAAGERRRQAEIVIDRHKHDVDVAGVRAWSAAEDDLVRATEDANAAYAALWAHVLGGDDDAE